MTNIVIFGTWPDHQTIEGQFWANWYFFSIYFQVTDNNYKVFLKNWQMENKPRVLLFDQVPVVSLLYKVSLILS